MPNTNVSQNAKNKKLCFSEGERAHGRTPSRTPRQHQDCPLPARCGGAPKCRQAPRCRRQSVLGQATAPARPAPASTGAGSERWRARPEARTPGCRPRGGLIPSPLSPVEGSRATACYTHRHVKPTPPLKTSGRPWVLQWPLPCVSALYSGCSPPAPRCTRRSGAAPAVPAAPPPPAVREGCWASQRSREPGSPRRGSLCSPPVGASQTPKPSQPAAVPTALHEHSHSPSPQTTAAQPV